MARARPSRMRATNHLDSIVKRNERVSCGHKSVSLGSAGPLACSKQTQNRGGARNETESAANALKQLLWVTGRQGQSWQAFAVQARSALRSVPVTVCPLGMPCARLQTAGGPRHSAMSDTSSQQKTHHCTMSEALIARKSESRRSLNCESRSELTNARMASARAACRKRT